LSSQLWNIHFNGVGKFANRDLVLVLQIA
jgi:hypothetical protein